MPRDLIVAGPITIDPQTREARAHGDLLLLSEGEFDLLCALAAEPHRVWTAAEMLRPDAVPSARGHGPSWLHNRALRLSSQLLRVGVPNDLTRSDGCYRLFAPRTET